MRPLQVRHVATARRATSQPCARSKENRSIQLNINDKICGRCGRVTLSQGCKGSDRGEFHIQPNG
jgi:hypothetical protein